MSKPTKYWTIQRYKDYIINEELDIDFSKFKNKYEYCEILSSIGHFEGNLPDAPAKKQTPPAKKQTPPAKKQTPPAKKQTPPAKKQTSRAKSDNKSDNLSNYATQLANVNELGVAKYILEIKKLKSKSTTYNKICYDFNINETKIKNKGKVFLNDALSIKITQAQIMANELCEKYKNIIDVDWTNTKSRFKSFCNKEHNNNPADIVLKFNDEGKSNSFLGVSLKASFGKTDIGQYNSSICSFISGLMIKEGQANYGIYSNNRIEFECKSNCALVGNKIQDFCNAYKDVFYNEISKVDIH